MPEKSRAPSTQRMCESDSNGGHLCKMHVGFQLRTLVSLLSSKFFNFTRGQTETSTSTDRRGLDSRSTDSLRLDFGALFRMAGR
jgi:hypothetical protein